MLGSPRRRHDGRLLRFLTTDDNMRASTPRGLFLGACAALLFSAPVMAQCPGDDLLEENDDCASAVALPTGFTSGLLIHGAAHPNGIDADYYRVQVPATGGIGINAGFNPFLYDLDLTLYVDDGSCITQVAVGSPNGNGEGLFYLDSIGLTADYILAVVPADPALSCADYFLDVQMIPPTGHCPNPDVYEPNGSVAQATPLSLGTTTGPAINGDFDQDHWSYTVAPGEQLIIDVLFSQSDGDIDAQLLGVSGPNVFGGSHDDNESIGWTNNTASPVAVTMVVYPFSVPSCAEYTLQVGFGEVGTRFCFGDGNPAFCPCANNSVVGAQQGCVNSSGVGAKLTASGTAFHASDDLVFTVTNGIPNQPSVLVQGSQQISVPFRDGILCMGNPTERVEIVFLNGAGSGSTSGSIVTQGNVPGPGATRYYQQWYRDPGGISPCGQASNLTSAVEIHWL